MSGQYNFPPPPPPGPPPSSYTQPNPQYGYGQPPQHQANRGGGIARGGRGGYQGGRGDSHNTGPYSHQNGYTGPQQAGPPQGPPIGYNPHNPAAGQYIGPQVSGPQGPLPQGLPQQGPSPQGYNPQWPNGPQQHGPHQHGPPQSGPPHQPPQMQQTPQPAPLSAQNYHPNYAPQAYQPPPQYGPPSQYQPQQPQYGQGPPQGAPQWSGPPQHNPAQFNRGRGRGGFGGTRGGHDAPLMGPPIRMGFDNGQNHMAQVGSGFPPPQFSNQHGPPPSFTQPHHQGFAPNSFQRPPFGQDQNAFNSQRGRGNSNFRGRGGRGDFQFSGRSGHHQNGSHRSPSHGFQKPASSDGSASKKKKKRRTNTLGLTPNGADHEESEEEEDIDEEARLVTLLGPDTPMMPSDLSAWLAERKSKFPTKARREAAAAAALEEHRKRSERKADKARHQQNEKTKHEGGTELEKQQRELEKLRLRLAREEKKMQDLTSGSKRKRETGDEGDDVRDQASNASGEDSGSSSGDDKPETISSRNSGPQRISQQPKAQLQRHCKYFSTGGTCGKKGKCRFVHDPQVREQALKDKEANGGKMTLAQRLILNDTAKDDLTILKSIKYLKEKGLLGESNTNITSNEDGNEENGYSNMEYGDASST